MYLKPVNVTGTVIGKSNQAGFVDPCEDREKATRPGARARDRQDPVRALAAGPCRTDPGAQGGLKASAKAVLRLADNGDPALEAVSKAWLGSLFAKGGMPTCGPGFFLFRKESAAYSRPVKGMAWPFRVLQVGPVIPEAPMAAPFAGPRSVQIGGSVGKTVVTAVIDDLIGVANARFRRAGGSSRVARFWVQGMPAIADGAASIGAEYDVQDISDAIAKSTDEADAFRALHGRAIFPTAPAGPI